MDTFNNALIKETQNALDAIERIRELHRGYYWTSEDRQMCNQCTMPYPCLTIQAINDGGK